MSKNKHHNRPKTDDVNNNVVEESINNESDIVSENIVNENDKEVVVDNVETMPVSEEIVTDIDNSEESVDAVKKIMPNSNFYRAGTDYIGDKCINLIGASHDLTSIKTICNDARNTYKKTYYVFDKSGNVVYTAEYSTPKDNLYRVGTEWKNGTCINQKFTSIYINEASESANDNTKITGIVHHVFDPSGRVVFSAKKKLTLLSLRKRGNKNDSWYS